MPPVMRDPMNAQGFRTQRAEMPEDLWQPLYDRVNIATAVPSALGFFATPKGQSATLITGTSAASKVKTYRDTNIENANVVPTKMFKIVGVSVGYVHSDPDAPANAQDRSLVRNGGYLQFRIVDKDILFLPLIFVPETNPIISAATTATATTIMAEAGGGGQNVPMYRFPVPVTLNPYENFSSQVNFDGSITVGATLDMYLILHAYMRRPT